MILKWRAETITGSERKIMCKAERQFDSPIANGMIRYLSDKYPIPGRVVLFKQRRTPVMYVLGKKATATIYLIDKPVLHSVICVGDKNSKTNAYDLARRIAHEYRHALQVFRDGKVYTFPYDGELEKDAIAFGKEAVAGLMKESHKYFGISKPCVD